MTALLCFIINCTCDIHASIVKELHYSPHYVKLSPQMILRVFLLTWKDVVTIKLTYNHNHTQVFTVVILNEHLD